MGNDFAARRTGPAGGADTYTILLTGFRAPVILPGGDGATARFDLELTVLHPGPEFPDDIAAVMSYEDIVQALRDLCAEETAADAGRLAEKAADLTIGLPKVTRTKVSVALSGVRTDEPARGATIMRERT
ncbi:hypothetical protein HL658_00300 [Azospirillum sp. RWY-5-1]|uniref:Dihydroneopterin aldolase n=1 Tax=Azospirillum oleiclasticum TaxID=2735135 RepID=A0ABX2T1F2_9PROT|nr:hypothetical protein [Azospirillum oleiclasticum]NYZ10972.1 hypothetical protein [Azospirillum oleiclasticum]NYZ18134.1 hypothetical protein [Azospirillum oleiclasticum]